MRSDLALDRAGANVVAALPVAERLGLHATVVTVACDSGLRYLSTDVFTQSD
jgi:cysteine synthase A